MEEQHVYHQNDDRPRFSTKVERNTKGFNWEVGVSNCTDPEECVKLTRQVAGSMARVYGAPAMGD